MGRKRSSEGRTKETWKVICKAMDDDSGNNCYMESKRFGEKTKQTQGPISLELMTGTVDCYKIVGMGGYEKKEWHSELLPTGCIWSLALNNCTNYDWKYIETKEKAIIRLEFPKENNKEGLEWVKIAMPVMEQSKESRKEMMEAIQNAAKNHLDSLAERNNEGPVDMVSVYMPLEPY